ncbi:hypothetical protein Pen02_79870 [Plantactinospora endophytica]|uniref:Transposase IS204/IS1001/IS1096/IS1165 DDE domain-containing protein n=1 Tax=Plantactinospora endophytica TaxID=673535 RepID=A0ABQ4EEA3_9ACTN|nr:hypothetical protein Pen02_79870 [Plantactinospora endophytica]
MVQRVARDICLDGSQRAAVTSEVAGRSGQAVDHQPPADGPAVVDSTDLPHLHTFTRGLGLDCDAVNAALTHPFHNGGTEGVNTKTKLIKRQMYGRAGFALLRHRILLG